MSQLVSWAHDDVDPTLPGYDPNFLGSTAVGGRMTKYLAGGALKFQTPHGTFISRNLTPDQETGIGRRTDDEVKRVLRPDGR